MLNLVFNWLQRAAKSWGHHFDFYSQPANFPPFCVGKFRRRKILSKIKHQTAGKMYDSMWSSNPFYYSNFIFCLSSSLIWSSWAINIFSFLKSPSSKWRKREREDKRNKKIIVKKPKFNSEVIKNPRRREIKNLRKTIQEKKKRFMNRLWIIVRNHYLIIVYMGMEDRVTL